MNTTSPDPLPGVPREAFGPGGLLALAIVASFLANSDAIGWGVSAATLRDGRWWTLISHMFAHSGFIHLAFNVLILFFLSGPIFQAMGRGAQSWLRFMALFLACGLAGAAAYVLIDPASMIPAIGASGAVFGFIGMSARLPGPIMAPATRQYKGVSAKRVRPLTADLLGRNLFLIAILSLPALLAPGAMQIAWEAHLGGFLAGLLLGPLFLPRH